MRKIANGLVLFILFCLALAGCGSDARNVTNSSRPRLVGDVTLAPTTPAPTRILTPTPSPIVIPVSTSELTTPLAVFTIDAGFSLVTPTLPPSKTPTVTPSQTLTATISPTFLPFSAVTTNPVFSAPSQSAFIPSTPVSINPPPQVCPAAWFFTQPTPQSCPLNPPLVSQASYQQFQQGFMLWVQEQAAVYVFYDSANLPRWEVFRDTFQEGMPERDDALDLLAPPYTWQPRRGFGLIWRSNLGVQQRIGWSVREYEEIYVTQVQIAQDGTIYLQEIRGAIISLKPGGQDWERWVGL